MIVLLAAAIGLQDSGKGGGSCLSASPGHQTLIIVIFFTITLIITNIAIKRHGRPSSDRPRKGWSVVRLRSVGWRN